MTAVRREIERQVAQSMEHHLEALVSDYERDKLRLNAEMVVRFAAALRHWGLLPMNC